MKHEMPSLHFSHEALSPRISAETINYHYGKHLQNYVNKLNELIAGTFYEDMELTEIVCKGSGAVFNNAAQVWNHEFYFSQLSPTPTEMSSQLNAQIIKSFGSIQEFKNELLQNAANLFGSGWTWVAMNNNKELSIINENNAGNPLTRGLHPILTIDVWEHAYYIDYRNNRAEYLKKLWELIDWNTIEKRMQNDECNIYF